jgi:zinc/manganese transport system permease protein
VTEVIERLFSFDGIGELLAEGFVQNALIACALLGLVAGALAPLIVTRGMAFAVHGSSELAFTGGAAALLLGTSVSLGAAAGAVVAGAVFGILGLRQRNRDSAIGVVLSFGLGLGVLLLALYSGRASSKFGLLIGSIVSVTLEDLIVLAVTSTVLVVAIAILYRPLLFSSMDPEVAAARGVKVPRLSVLFAVLVGLLTAVAVPIVGAILVLSVTITPGAAAVRISSNPAIATVLAIVFAETALLGGAFLSLVPGLPISGYVATISFLIYLSCRLISRARRSAPAT